MRIKPLLLSLLVLVATAAHAQEQAATETPAKKLAKMRAAGNAPESVATSFGRRVADSTKAPWRAVGRVNIGGRAHCTGSLVAEDIVLTAAHCLYDKAQKKMVVPSVVHFLAGYHAGAYEGHSRVVHYTADPAFDGTLGAKPQNLPHDWALLKLADPLGATLGFLPFPKDLQGETGNKALTTRLHGLKITVAGYPQDRAHMLSLAEGCRVRAVAYKGRVMLTDCVSVHGDSGGPILQADGPGGGLHIIGIDAASTRLGTRNASLGVSVLAFWPAFKAMRDTETSAR
ncbi:trypsin-like serine peptidase [Kordiimonas marina]|uniref:trypsin-like serine peptidase n=1 Tax=Kordiimonas marina TaxID=2872312 RepID=UPI001FF5C188|nr:trypsin-like serine protease [Kordiimonas marina]MCJ9428501.1 trypsin-like serine protease [Kordiimonas marina]